MYYISSDITIHMDVSIEALAQQVSDALSIRKMQLDKSGRYEGDTVYSSVCFGLEFELAKDDPPLNSYHLSVNTDTDSFDIDSTAKDVDGVEYILALLESHGINAERRDPKLLFD